MQTPQLQEDQTHAERDNAEKVTTNSESGRHAGSPAVTPDKKVRNNLARVEK